ncbi:MAG: transposase [Bacillota bacterium]|nr:transposase [Bacillota bacterium]
MRSCDRKSIRLKDYNYSQPGYYFITICTINRDNILSNIIQDSINLSKIGQTVMNHLNNINLVYENVNLDSNVIMPNHIHLILELHDNGRLWAAAPTNPPIFSIPRIVNSFKTLTSKKYGSTLWQRGYYDHVIRGESELNKIREYIINNPAKWQEDEYNV